MIDKEAKRHQENVARACRAWMEAREVESNALARRAETAKVKGAHASLENQGRAVAADLHWRRAQDQTRAAEVELDTALHGAECHAGEPHARAGDLGLICEAGSALVDAAAELRRAATEAEQKAAARLADAGAAREALAVSRAAAGMVPPAMIPSPSAERGAVNRSPGRVLPPELRRRSFEPFYSNRPAGAATGLGLSVSYGIVKAHGGSIEVQSEPGVGTTVVLSLPLSAPR